MTNLLNEIISLRDEGTWNTLPQRFHELYTLDNKGHTISEIDLLDRLMTALAMDLCIDDSSSDELLEINYYRGCYYCGEEVKLELHKQTRTLTVVTEPCKYPDGLSVEWTLEVPSGKIVIDDDLRSFMGLGEQAMPETNDTNWRDYDVNSAWGIRNTALWYAERGMAHGLVGNSCPTFYRTSKRFRAIFLSFKFCFVFP